MVSGSRRRIFPTPRHSRLQSAQTVMRMSSCISLPRQGYAILLRTPRPISLPMFRDRSRFSKPRCDWRSGRRWSMPVPRRSMAQTKKCRFPRAIQSIILYRSMPQQSALANCWLTPIVTCISSTLPVCASSRSTAPMGVPTWRRGCSPRRSSRASRSACSTMAKCSGILPSWTISSAGWSARCDA